MKILAYGDCHLRDYGSFPPYNVIDSNGLTKELNNILCGFKFVADKINENTPDIVVNLGDLYTVTETVSTRTLHASSIGLGYIKAACDELGIRHYYVCGQHEVISESQMISSVSNLVGYFNEIFTEYSVMPEKGCRLSFIPHITHPLRMASALTRAQEESDIIFCHANFRGCIFDNGFSSTSEISPKLRIPCISGDIHNKQQIDSVIYPGSLVQNKFSRTDMDGVGGVVVYDTVKGYQHFPNTYSKHYLKVTDIDLAMRYNRDRVLLQVHTSLDRESVDKLLSGYEYWMIPVSKQSVKKEYTNDFRVEDPKKVLRSYIEANKPDAVCDFDRIFG